MRKSKIYELMHSDPIVSSIFSGEQLVANILKIEVTLAEVQGELSIIPQEAAEEIATKSVDFEVDLDRLQQGTHKAGFPIVALLAQLREHVGGQAGDHSTTLGTMARVVDQFSGCLEQGQAQSADATDHPLPDQAAGVWFMPYSIMTTDV